MHGGKVIERFKYLIFHLSAIHTKKTRKRTKAVSNIIQFIYFQDEINDIEVEAKNVNGKFE